MEKTVARLNIKHFREMLTEELDEATRQMVSRLLAEEEAKLARLTHWPKAAEAGTGR